MIDPCIITGCARSRTSLVMQILQISGAFLGSVIGVTGANPQGQLELRQIIDQVQKPWLKQHGFDPKGQYPLPPEDFDSIDPHRRQQVEKIFAEQGFTERPFFKDAKACLDWVAWNYAFPDAIWIIVRRNEEGIIKSCLSPKAPFMSAFNNEKGWRWWVHEHIKRFEQIKANCKYIYEIDTDKIVAEDFSEIKPLVEDLGLVWDEEKTRKNLAKT